MQVKVRALIRHGDLIVVAAERERGGGLRLTLPGGLPRPGERVLDALAREVREETGSEIQVGRLLYVAEAVDGRGRLDLNLVFAASPSEPIDESAVYLVDPREAHEPPVLPPILDTVPEDAAGPAATRWLGEVSLSVV